MGLLTATLDDMLPLHHWLAFSADDPNGDNPPSAPAASEITSDWLFAASGQAVLILDAVTGVILRANPASLLLLNLSPTSLPGAHFLSIFEDASADNIQRGLSEALNSGSAVAPIVRERRGGRSLSVQLSLVRNTPQSYLLARLESSPAATASVPNMNPESAVMEALDAAPMGFLIAAADYHVDYANRAFVRMVEAQSQADVRGSSVLRWLRFNAADLSRLSARLLQRQAADMLTTLLHPNVGSPQPVQVCAVPVPDGLNTQWGFTVRHLPRLN